MRCIRMPPLRTPQRRTSLNARYGKFATDCFELIAKTRASIAILIGRLNQDFPLTGMIRLADNTFLLHAFHQRGGTVVLQTPLNITGRAFAIFDGSMPEVTIIAT